MRHSAGSKWCAWPSRIRISDTPHSRSDSLCRADSLLTSARSPSIPFCSRTPSCLRRHASSQQRLHLDGLARPGHMAHHRQCRQAHQDCLATKSTKSSKTLVDALRPNVFLSSRQVLCAPQAISFTSKQQAAYSIRLQLRLPAPTACRGSGASNSTRRYALNSCSVGPVSRPSFEPKVGLAPWRCRAQASVHRARSMCPR